LRYDLSIPSFFRTLLWKDIEIFFLYLLRWSCDFCPWFYFSVYWFEHVEPSSHSWYGLHLIIVYDLFNVLLNSVHEYFIETSCVCVHERNWSIILFFVVALSSFGLRVTLTL
jgi:hypothetical protein